MDVLAQWPPPKARWTVRMLGRMEVVSTTGERPKFRSRSVQALFAYLSLHPGKDVSRFLLEETLWPGSDSDKQAQNLRRAVADLRQALESDGERGEVVETRRDVVRGCSESVASDASRFLELAESGLETGNADVLTEAVSLYDGPLLAPMTDDWIHPYRLEFEDRFGQCVEAVCRLHSKAGNAREAVRTGRAAILAAPTREDIHIALIRAYRAAGYESEALRQYEDLERMMDEDWGEVPSAQAREALEGKLPETPAPASARPVTDSELSGGAMALDSRFYVRRPVDGYAEHCLDRGESVLLIQGPRQVGKSSLLARTIAYAKTQGMAAVLTDFQTIGESQLGDGERLYRTLAHTFATQLKAEIDLDAVWSPWLGPNMNLDAVFGRVLEQAEGNVCWAIDEADRAFGRPYANDFFGLLRSWHNRRALDPQGPWSRLTLMLSYAADAHLFISDLNQSPFNVGVTLPLRDFTRGEAEELADRFGLKDPDSVDAAYAATNGHPFLCRRAMAFLSQGGSAKELQTSASLADGPFGDHLNMVLGYVSQDPNLVAEVCQILSGKGRANPAAVYRLMTAGIVKAGPKPEFRVPAYEPFLRAALG